nr:retrovirus-related Pol polyprotein from transposon TNT 1-94 [Tanacetum cinerariifolium]
MTSEQFSLGPRPQLVTFGYISSGLPPSSVVSLVLPATAPLHADTTGTPSTTIIVQDAPSISTSPTTQEIQAPVIHEDPSSEESSSQGVIPLNLHQLNQSFKNIRKWKKDHPLDNVIGNPSRHVSTISQLQTNVIWCYFDAHGHSIPFGGKRLGITDFNNGREEEKFNPVNKTGFCSRDWFFLCEEEESEE